MADETAELGARLQAFLAEQMPATTDVRISGLHRSPAGVSRENWPFDAHWGEGDRTVSAELLLRRDPRGSVLVTDRRLEFSVLRAIEGTPIPAPRARWLDAAGAALGRPSIIMDRLPGTAEMFVLRGALPEERRLALAHHYCELLASVHLLDWRANGLEKVLDDPGDYAAQAEVDYWEAELRREALEPQPELELVLAWLRARAPAAQATVLVHGDFKPGNTLVQDGEVVALLDWETAHLGDPLEDIGWVTNPLRAREHTIPELWEHRDLCTRWSELTGFRVDPAAVRFWNVLANLKLAVIVLTGVRSFVEGRGDRVRAIPSAILGLIFDLMDAAERGD